MKWHRDANGVYTSGPFTVQHHAHAGGFWTADGPHVKACSWPTKRQAQIDAGQAASARAADPNVTPVVGDVVMVSGTRRGQITAIMRGDREPLYCIVFARGRKLCLFRREIEVIVP
ncbi:hypothetical protein PHELEMICH_93 [Mycobacterium phage Phelemich]|uniref:Uncharacterized protein n=2 Tax=Acadianvirus reprobate TaxID=1982903 RepID=S5Y7U5_9CAUD|nr:hypothetical protein N847_gp93 [Mycobacterium phage Phelemich]YP_008410016.1 hypothetical protein REPROBATE_95 [Mycobacterium phage Reprobate]AGT12831.1 hypothetical protein REPROBATE_95 [Mycobacterium phage Reprobate]AGT14007.1 hypothetical protein PHELEMICH_93 [Mycobacterium phage Phelemich]